MIKRIFNDAQRIANKLCDQSIMEIEGVKDIEYPIDLDAVIVVMKSGSKFLLRVTQYDDE